MPPRYSLKIRAFLVGALLTIGASSFGQYANPESVEYDPTGDRYFVGNTGSQLIRSRDQDGTVTTFVDVEASPYGLELLNGVLYACVGGSIKGYALNDASLQLDIDLGGTFLNGLTTDGQALYATDFGSSRIFKVDVDAATFQVLVSNTNGTPNGIVWDPAGERLVVVFWGNNAPIKAFDPVSGAAQTLVANTGLGNIDGVTIDCQGNFLVASWSPDRITRYEPTFTGAGVDLGVTGLNNPADIDFDEVNDRVCIPNTGTNSVILAEVDCSTGLKEERTYATRVHPNPTRDLVRFDPPFPSAEPFMVVDGKGRLQATGTLRSGAALDLGDLPAGPYVILFTRLAEQVRVLKE
ncbi:MAG: SMP-30/gluconolactonase/LRE family protein [Flavobacteriales bacterium]